MKTKTLTQPTIRKAEVPFRSVNEASANSSAVLGVNLLGDWEDVLAVFRTAVLLAQNLGGTLFVALPGEDVLPVPLGEVSSATLVSKLGASAKAQRRCRAAHSFAMEIDVMAASFICAGSITIRVHDVDMLEKSAI